MNQETYVPGISGSRAESPRNTQPRPQSYNETQVGLGQRAFTDQSPMAEFGAQQTHNTSPVVGFVYTLSNGGSPEYWPIRIGVNTIGSASDNDISLLEESVSAHHAQINVKRLQRSGGKLVAGIKDVGSSNGVLLNEEELDYELHNCNNGDVITVGYNYKLVLLLIDPVKYGIGASDNFRPIQTEPQPSVFVPLDEPTIPQRQYQTPNFNGEVTVDINNPAANDISGGRTKVL